MSKNIVQLNIKSDFNDALNEAKTLIKNKSITSSQLAKELGVSPATISQILNDSYNADPTKILEKLNNWVKLRKSKGSAPILNPGFVLTTTAQQIINDIMFAHVAADDGIVVIYGAPGVGKSQAIKYYQKNNNNVWMIFACPSLAGLTPFLYELALELGIPNPPKRKDELSRLIKRKVHQTQGVLIIDEAQHLNFETLEELRIIQEQTALPMVLSGNKRTYSKMTGGARTEDFAQQFSRIAKKRGIHKVKKQDVKLVAKAWGIEGNSEQALMVQISERPGGLRLLSKTLKLAAMYTNGAPITEAVLHTAFTELESNE